MFKAYILIKAIINNIHVCPDATVLFLIESLSISWYKKICTERRRVEISRFILNSPQGKSGLL